jgi:protein-S-isoprenylcysteine O-methyltransferase Ste14
MHNYTIAFELLWLGWGITWFLAAPWSAPTVVRQSPADRLRHLIPFMLGGGLFLATTRPTTLLGHALLPPAEWQAWVGLALTFLGLAFAIWARFTLGKLWSGNVTLKADHRLVQEGPYKITRHPIYTGLLLALLGTALARDTLAVALGFLCLTGTIVLKLRQEERLLAQYFGPAFDDYRHRVRTLVPFLW